MQVREYLAFLAARGIKTAITKNCCWQQFGSAGYTTAPEGFPVHVESVAWLTERKDVLSSFFYLAAIISYMIYRKKDKYKPLFYTLLLLSFILSCLAKSSAVTLPVILVVIDYFSHKKFNYKTIVNKIPLFVISLVWGIITTIKNKGSIASSEAFSLLERTLFAFYGIVNYLYKLIVPVNLSCFYPYPNLIDGRLPIIFYIAPFIVLFLAFLVYKSVKHTKTVVFGALFFFFRLNIRKFKNNFIFIDFIKFNSTLNIY